MQLLRCAGLGCAVLCCAASEPTSFASFCKVRSRESFPRCFGMTLIATCRQDMTKLTQLQWLLIMGRLLAERTLPCCTWITAQLQLMACTVSNHLPAWQPQHTRA